MATWSKPVPSASAETAPFWDACRKGNYLLQQCRACGNVQAYYRGFCAHCWSQDIEDLLSSGKGTVHTFTVTYQNRAPGFREETPYVVAVVELERGVQVFANIINCDPASVRIGLPVKVTFMDVGEEMKVPMFEPA